jgi:hypothetical protein
MSGGDPFNLSTMAQTPNLAPPPSALAPPQSVLSAGRDQAMQDADSAAQMAQQDVNRERQSLQQQRGQVAPFRQAAMDANARPLPQPPQHQQPPKPPKMEDAQQQTWQQEWLTAAMFLGTLGGALTRRPLTNSLAAFTGMIEGVNEGNKQKFDTSMKTWEAENKRVLEANEQANKEYDQILKSRQLDTEQKMVMLQLKAMELKDDAMAQAAITKDQIAVAQLHDQRMRYGTELKGAQDRRDQEKQERMQQHVLQRMTQPGSEKLAQDIAHGLAPARPTSRTTNEQSLYNDALMERAREIAQSEGKEYDQTAYQNRQAAGRVEATTDPMTTRRTEIAFAVGGEARSVRSNNVAVDHLSFLSEKLIPALKNGDINVINEYKNRLQQEVGAPAPTNFDAAKQIIGQEIVKAVVANGGGVTERQEAARFISNARSEAQLQGIVRVYERLMLGQIEGLKQQYEGGGGRKPFDQTFLRPATREALNRQNLENFPDIPNEMTEHVQRLAERFQGIGAESANSAGKIAEKATSPGFLGQAEGAWNKIHPHLPEGWSLTPME